MSPRSTRPPYPDGCWSHVKLSTVPSNPYGCPVKSLRFSHVRFSIFDLPSYRCSDASPNRQSKSRNLAKTHPLNSPALFFVRFFRTSPAANMTRVVDDGNPPGGGGRATGSGLAWDMEVRGPNLLRCASVAAAAAAGTCESILNKEQMSIFQNEPSSCPRSLGRIPSSTPSSYDCCCGDPHTHQPH